MLDHVSIQCVDVVASAAFYDAVLAPLGIKRVMDFGTAIGYGTPPRPDFWIGAAGQVDGFREAHLAFAAPDRATVRAFFETARGLAPRRCTSRGCGRNTTTGTMRPTSATRRATTSKPSVTRPSNACRACSVCQTGGMLRVGLTGGIGSGKSAVSSRLAALGAVVIDADKAARAVVEPGTAGLAQVAAAFGPGVLAADGSLDRPKLAAVVFGDQDQLARLNAVVHPLVRAYTRAAEEAAIADGDPALVLVHDIPLLAESGRAGEFDRVIVVDVPPQVQVERLSARRGDDRGPGPGADGRPGDPRAAGWRWPTS